VSLTVWDGDETPRPAPPTWLLTGHMLLWGDGSPAHVDMEPFTATDEGWEARLMVSRSTLGGTRWLTLRMTITLEARAQWDAQRTSARARALQLLANYIRLTEWYGDDLGVLELK
jgi:hypothetical protein